MTICVAVRVHDCIVFAADSASTLTAVGPNGQPAVLNVFQHGNKVFNLYKHLPVCAMTCGIGVIGGQSISSIAKDLRVRLTSGSPDWKIDDKNYSIADIAAKARRYIYDEIYKALAEKPGGSFEFWIGGYSSGSVGHELWKVTINDDGTSPEPERVSSDGQCGLNWSGQGEPINRLVAGFGYALDYHLAAAGINAADLAKLMPYLQSNMEARLVSEGMPIQDAIDLARFLVETTKGFFRFLPGADIVGGGNRHSRDYPARGVQVGTA